MQQTQDQLFPALVSASDWFTKLLVEFVNASLTAMIRHLQITQHTVCLSPKILHKALFLTILGTSSLSKTI